MGSKTSWALCCSMLSLSGFFFLFAVGILVKLQPQYMKLSKDVEGPAPIFESACLYGTLFVVSTTVYYMETRKTSHSYDLLESTDGERRSLLDTPMTSYN